MPDRSELSRGFSLIEMMVVVAVLAIILSIAMPNMTDMIDRQRVVGAAEDIRALLSLARSEAIKQSTNVEASIVTGTGAYVGLSHNGTCDSNRSNCTITLGGIPVTKIVDIADYRGVSITQADDAEDSIVFTSRGVPAVIGTGTAITLTSAQGSALNVVTSPIGRVSICTPGTSNNSGTYPSCQ